jgi:Gram-negative bacterial TonB protein C-terminal
MKRNFALLFLLLLNLTFIPIAIAQPANDSIKRGEDLLELDRIADVREDENSGGVPYYEPEIIYQSEKIEVQPEFPGGKKAMNTFIAKNFIISKEMINNEMERILFVSFIVENDGKLKDIKVLRNDILSSAKEEAINMVKKMPNWLPGEHNGKKVKCYFTIPIYINAKK